MSDSIYFDNLLITDNLPLADAHAAETFQLKLSKIDVASGGMFRRSPKLLNKLYLCITVSLSPCLCLSIALSYVFSKEIRRKKGITVIFIIYNSNVLYVIYIPTCAQHAYLFFFSPRILDYSNKNPWLYAVYVVLVGLPLVLIITFCCSGEKETKGKQYLRLLNFFYQKVEEL